MAKTSLTMMEVACRIDVPDKVIQNPIIQELLQKSNEIVVWSNVSTYIFPEQNLPLAWLGITKFS